MKIVQKLIATIAILIAFLAIMVLPARSAVVVSDITDVEFSSLISTSDAAWSVMYRGGGMSGVGAEQIRLARNTATPQVGGGSDTLVGNLSWSSAGNDLEIEITAAGNISARANAITVGTLPITRPYNQILLVVYDESDGGFSDLQKIKINGQEVRNMFAQGAGGSDFDVLSVTNFGPQAPFTFDAVWNTGNIPNSDDRNVWIVALNNAAIPEPSVSLLLGFVSLLLLRRQR